MERKVENISNKRVFKTRGNEEERVVAGNGIVHILRFQRLFPLFRTEDAWRNSSVIV